MQGLHVDSLTTTVCTVKILAVDMHILSLDVVINLMRCFPCLEKLYIEVTILPWWFIVFCACLIYLLFWNGIYLLFQSNGPGETNLWRRKHGDLIRSLAINLKTISLRYYRGIKSHVDFVTFFVLNAKVLELMTLKVNNKDYSDEFIAQHCKMLRLDSRASRGAPFQFTPEYSHHSASYFHVNDLDLADPFEWKEPYKSCALS